VPARNRCVERNSGAEESLVLSLTSRIHSRAQAGGCFPVGQFDLQIDTIENRTADLSCVGSTSSRSARSATVRATFANRSIDRVVSWLALSLSSIASVEGNG
jgi:hypothetical protein